MSESVKELPEREYPNECGTVYAKLDAEILRQILLDEMTKPIQAIILRLFEQAILGHDLLVVDGARGKR